jgi:hypothetical protein
MHRIDYISQVNTIVHEFNRKRGTDTSKKSDGLNYNVVVCFPLSEMMWACTCIPRVCKMHILCSRNIVNPVHSCRKQNYSLLYI